MSNEKSAVSGIGTSLCLLIGIWRHLNSSRRSQFALLFVLMVIASIVEVVSIGAVLPFLSVLTASDQVFSHPFVQPIIVILDIKTPQELLLPLTIAFSSAALMAGALRLLLLWANTKLSFSAGSDISTDIYRRTLYQSYAVHVSRNSGEVVNAILYKANSAIHGALLPALTMLNAVVLLVAIVGALLFIDPMIAISAFVGFGSIYICVIKVVHAKLASNSRQIAVESGAVMKMLQEGLGGVRDVLLDGSQEIYCQTYKASDRSLRQAQGSNEFIGHSPRYGVEALGMVLIAALAYVLTQQSMGVAKAIPVLGALALGAQRLIPVLQQSYVSWATMQGARASLSDTLALLDQPIPEHASSFASSPLSFSKEIRFENVYFRYESDSQWVIEDLSLEIKKGARIGLIGKTGSGKSTAIDILMCLLLPTAGQVLVDDIPVTGNNIRRWQLHISHVPQSIYLADCSVAENIAFGVPIEQIDWESVSRAAKQAQIADVIETWPARYQTKVGERGVRLSGGQRQRIAIARALYKKSDILVFDEATSALDGETERSVMQAIDGLSKELTIVIVAHRLSTLVGCSEIIELNAGKVLRRGTFEEIVSVA